MGSLWWNNGEGVATIIAIFFLFMVCIKQPSNLIAALVVIIANCLTYFSIICLNESSIALKLSLGLVCLGAFWTFRFIGGGKGVASISWLYLSMGLVYLVSAFDLEFFNWASPYPEVIRGAGNVIANGVILSILIMDGLRNKSTNEGGA